MLAMKGAAMGIAEAIPGVSGGTIAFITGIYEELINTIKSITPSNLKLILHDRRAFWVAINGNFLLWLLVGMVIGLGFGIFIISHLLEHHQSLLWAGFFGLVFASIFLLGKDIQWSPRLTLFAIIGALFAYYISSLTPSSGSDNALYIIMAGMIAISALMLPGVSGSFMLLLLGLYSTIVNGLKSLITDQDLTHLKPIVLFSIGALFGLFSFARLLSYLFKTYRSTTMATMIGVLIGSLSKLWPWKRITQVFDKSLDRIIPFDGNRLTDESAFKIITEQNILPGTYASYEDPRILLVLISFVLGILIVYFLGKLSPPES